MVFFWKFSVFTAILSLFILLNSNERVYANTLPVEKPPIFMNFCEGAQTPADKQACTQQRFENAEKALNIQFQSLLLFLKDTDYMNALKSTQNTWLSYRNSECDFESGFFEEDAAKRTLKLSCMSRMTEERAMLLYNFIPRTRFQAQNNTNKDERG